jgi:hypothetical protein
LRPRLRPAGEPSGFGEPYLLLDCANRNWLSMAGFGKNAASFGAEGRLSFFFLSCCIYRLVSLSCRSGVITGVLVLL